MYRRVPCDWFLCDGIFRRVRLDAPMLLTEALEDAGMISAGGSFTDRLAREWIYRRTWTYSAQFSYADGLGRAFIRLSGIAGNHETILNGTVLGADELEVTSLLQPMNTLEVRFPPDTTFAARPVMGFCGQLMLRRTREAAITRMRAEADGTVKLTLDAPGVKQLTIKYALSSGDRRVENEFSETAAPEFAHNPFGPLPTGARCDLSCEVYIKKALSDDATDSLYVPGGIAALRGCVATTEALTGLCQQAGASCVFTATDDTSVRTFAARHKLFCEALAGTGPVKALPALMPVDRVNELAGQTDALTEPAFWKLTGVDPEWLNTLPEGDLDYKVTVSRVRQALDLRARALEARLQNRVFALAGADEGLSSPASCALIDSERSPRPAYYALKSAWQPWVGFTRMTGEVSEDGIFSCEVCLVTDESPDKLVQLKVSAWALNGKLISSSSYAASGRMGIVGRFISELPEDGMCIVRTELLTGFESRTTHEALVTKPDISFDKLPETQLLLAPDSARNAGGSAAVYVTVSEAGFFGCLLPGEKVPADRATGAEGLNIYF